MFTDNYFRLMATNGPNVASSYANEGYKTYTIYGGTRGLDGYAYSQYCNYAHIRDMIKTLTFSRSISLSDPKATSTYILYIAFGDGTTPPTKADYKIEHEVALSRRSSGLSVGGDGYAKPFVVVTREETTPVTVSEVALYTRIQVDGQSYRTICIFREVIPPVTIQPGELYTFEISMRGVEVSS